MRHRVLLGLVVPAFLAGCSHDAPFAAAPYGSDQPYATAFPRQITLNLGDDRAPAWLPDGSGLLYSFQPSALPDHCIGLLPPNGGQLEREICNPPPPGTDSAFILAEPAAFSDGRLAYRFTAWRPNGGIQSRVQLMLGSVSGAAAPQPILTFPLTPPDTVRQDGAGQIHWLDGTTLLYLAEHVGFEGRRSSDTVRSGAEIVELTIASPQSSIQIIPGTRDASSLALGAGGILYYTLGGDTRVYRRTLAGGGGSVAVVYDFATLGIVRDVSVAGTRLAAVVGGNVAFAYDSLLGFNAQRDGGGTLYLLDLTTGQPSLIADSLNEQPALFRRPALSPSGQRVVAEYVSGPDVDLWMFPLP